jgi:transcription elongation factor S-II
MSDKVGDTGGGRLKKKLSASKSIDKKPSGGDSTAASAAAAAVKAGADGRRSAPGSEPPSSGDAMRDKVRKLLSNALYQEGEGIVSGRTSVFPVVVDIETAMFESLKGVSQDYKIKFRELKFNFSDAKNRELREEVLGGSLKPDDVVRMTSKDLANAEKKEERRKMHEHNLREAAAGNKQEASTKEFLCGKCKKRECTYFQMQTRGADEPLTTFVHCVNCDNRWRF